MNREHTLNLLFIAIAIAVFCFLALNGCAVPTSMEAEPEEQQVVAECSRPVPGILTLAIHLSYALEQAEYAEQWTECCWIQPVDGERQWYRSLNVVGPEYSIYATRLLRPEERPASLDERVQEPMMGYLELVVAAVEAFEQYTPEKCWRVSDNGVLESFVLGLLGPVPGDYRWHIELRRML